MRAGTRSCVHMCACGAAVCPRVQKGHANIVLKRNRASESGARGKAREASKSKSERVTVGDPAAGCRQHSYNTTCPTTHTSYTIHATRTRACVRVRSHTRSAGHIHVHEVHHVYSVGWQGIAALGSRDNHREDGFARIDDAHRAPSNFNCKVRTKRWPV